MANVERYAAKSVFDPPAYSQAVKVTGAQTILFLAGQVSYDKDGTAKHRGDFTAQARNVLSCVKALVEAGGVQVVPPRGPKPLAKPTVG